MFTFSGSLCEACENNICNFKHLRRVASCLVIFQHHQYTHMYLRTKYVCASVFVCVSVNFRLSRTNDNFHFYTLFFVVVGAATFGYYSCGNIVIIY